MMEWFLQYWLDILFGAILGILAWIVRKISKHYKEEKDRNDAVRLGVQALLRSQMINDFNHYKEKGYAPIYAKENFENCWQRYHSLGVNGVMDGIHEDFMKLPTMEVGDKSE